MYKGIISLVLLLFFAFPEAIAQEIKPHGEFAMDTIKIGVPIPFSLSVRYPREVDVVFPDSLYDFSPYELDHKVYFPTQSDSINSYDSAVYYLTSFEIDSVQEFQLPIFVLHGNDSTIINSNIDQAILEQLVSAVPDSVAVDALPLKENADYIKVDFQFNYIYFLIGLGIIIIGLVVIIVVFGGKIKTQVKLWRMKKHHAKFIAEYEVIAQKGNISASEKANEVQLRWKTYLGKLEKKPYKELTTKEIVNRYGIVEAEEALKQMDRLIYGGQSIDNMQTDCATLKQIAITRYNKKVEEVKND